MKLVDIGDVFCTLPYIPVDFKLTIFVVTSVNLLNCIVKYVYFDVSNINMTKAECMDFISQNNLYCVHNTLDALLSSSLHKITFDDEI